MLIAVRATPGTGLDSRAVVRPHGRRQSGRGAVEPRRASNPLTWAGTQCRDWPAGPKTIGGFNRAAPLGDSAPVRTCPEAARAAGLRVTAAGRAPAGLLGRGPTPAPPLASDGGRACGYPRGGRTNPGAQLGGVARRASMQTLGTPVLWKSKEAVFLHPGPMGISLAPFCLFSIAAGGQGVAAGRALRAPPAPPAPTAGAGGLTSRRDASRASFPNSGRGGMSKPRNPWSFSARVCGRR